MESPVVSVGKLVEKTIVVTMDSVFQFDCCNSAIMSEQTQFFYNLLQAPYIVEAAIDIFLPAQSIT